jgi:hypothetical protein
MEAVCLLTRRAFLAGTGISLKPKFTLSLPPAFHNQSCDYRLLRFFKSATWKSSAMTPAHGLDAACSHQNKFRQ